MWRKKVIRAISYLWLILAIILMPLKSVEAEEKFQSVEMTHLTNSEEYEIKSPLDFVPDENPRTWGYFFTVWNTTSANTNDDWQASFKLNSCSLTATKTDTSKNLLENLSIEAKTYPSDKSYGGTVSKINNGLRANFSGIKIKPLEYPIKVGIRWYASFNDNVNKDDDLVMNLNCTLEAVDSHEGAPISDGEIVTVSTGKTNIKVREVPNPLSASGSGGVTDDSKDNTPVQVQNSNDTTNLKSDSNKTTLEIKINGKDIKELSETELKEVKKLTIEDKEMGGIEFKGELDLSKEKDKVNNIDEYVKIEKSKVTVISEKVKSLNTKAVVTLYNQDLINGNFKVVEIKGKKSIESEKVKNIEYKLKDKKLQFEVDGFSTYAVHPNLKVNAYEANDDTYVITGNVGDLDSNIQIYLNGEKFLDEIEVNNKGRFTTIIDVEDVSKVEVKAIGSSGVVDSFKFNLTQVDEVILSNHADQENPKETFVVMELIWGFALGLVITSVVALGLMKYYLQKEKTASSEDK